jgi:DNA helicase-2/ATP-dependent DNA helicase PcrA
VPPETTDRIDALLEGLNPPQRDAVTHGEGPLLILAGAGSGKTRVLTHRIAWLLRTKRARPDEILAITFTNKAAQEMRERVELLVGRATRAMWVMTFHSACARMLRADAHRLGYTRQFTIYDAADSRRLIKKCLDDLDIDVKRFTPRAMQAQISDTKNKLRSAEDYRGLVGSFFEQTAADVYEHYERELHRANAMDFDDLLFRAVNLLELFQEVRDRYAAAFRWVLVDEYQDTNHAQYRWLQLLAGEHRNLAVVGDDDQCLVAGTLVTMGDGTKRPIEDVAVGDEVMSCYGNGRFLPSRVTRTFAAEPTAGVEILTRAGRRIVSTPDHVHFAGYRAGMTPPLHMTYVMRRRDKGCRVGTTQTHLNNRGKSVVGIATRSMKERAEMAWVVATHSTDAEARAHEAILSLRYGLPTIPFVAHRETGRPGLLADQSLIDRIYASVDSEGGAVRLLHDHGMWPETPHHIAQTYDGARRTVVLTMCADGSTRSVLHTVSIGGRDEDARRKLESVGMTIKRPHPGKPGWRSEMFFRTLEAASQQIERIESVLDVTLRCVARLGTPQPGQTNSLPFMHASSVRPGMAMFAEDGSYDIVDEVRSVELDRSVHDLDVELTHNFVADGLVTHNSIYGFRGADIGNILNFEDDYVDAHVVRLEQNYRSTQIILSAANAVVANNRGRKAKSLWTEIGEGDPIKIRELADEHSEARFVVAEVERLVDEGVSRAELAVFYRTNAQSRVLEDMLVRAQIGYQIIGGTKFYERAEIKDAIAYLIFLINPADGGAFTRIANSPKRGIGQTSLSRVLAHADTMGVTPWEAAEHPDRVPLLGTAAQKALGRFMSTMERLRERAEGDAPVGEVLEEMLRETGYLDALEAERTIEAQGRIENLQELVQVAREYDATASGETRSVAEFLQQIALLSDADTRRDDEGLVTLMTLHNAKGLEFPIVFIIGCEDGIFPHSRALDEGDVEEERRLAYVGITRAMRDLYITYARRRNAFGANSHGLRSRFLDEIPRELTDQPDRNAVGIGRPAGAGRVASWTTAAAASADAVGAPAGGTDAAGQVFRLGDDVIHAAFGEGVVTGVEPGGIVVVHFAGDGSERKLMADYAPIRKR